MNKTEYIQILLKNDCGLQAETFLGGVWRPLANSPAAMHRSVSGNEIVFEIDCVPNDRDDWPAIHALAEKLEKRLNTLIIPFLRFSSGRNLHYHVYFNPLSGLPDNETYDIILRDYFHIDRTTGKREISMKENCELMRLIKNGIYFLILKGITETGAEFDSGPTCARAHMIRIEGGQNQKTGFYKSWLPDGLPAEQPKITESEVILPDVLPLWNMPDYFFPLAYARFVKPKKTYTLRKFSGESKTIGWIEQLIQTPIDDGRHRAVDLVLAPYLLNIKNLSEAETFQILMVWIEKCRELRNTAVNEQYLKQKIIYVKQKGLKPLRFDNLHIHGLDFLQNMKTAAMAAV